MVFPGETASPLFVQAYQDVLPEAHKGSHLCSAVYSEFIGFHVLSEYVLLSIYAGIFHRKIDISARNPSVRGCFSYCRLYFLIFWTKANQGKRSIPGIGGIYYTSHSLLISDNSIDQIFKILFHSIQLEYLTCE